MQMWASDASRLPGESQPLTLPQLVPRLHLYFRQVHVDSEQSLPMIHDHAVALVEQFLRQYHRPRVRYHNRRTLAYREVRPPMRTGQLLIENPGHPKRVRRLGLSWRHKIARPLRRGYKMRECPVLEHLIRRNLLLASRIRLDEVFRHVYRAAPKVGRSDVHLLQRVYDPPPSHYCRDG